MMFNPFGVVFFREIYLAIDIGLLWSPEFRFYK